MTVPSWSFLLFAAGAALLYNAVRGDRWRRAVLLAANLLFLGSFVDHPAAILPFASFLALGLLLVRLAGRGGPAWLHGAAIAIVIAMFFWLKQYSFLPAAIFIASPYLVVGLSYVFFRVLHLVIDAREDRLAADIPFADYLNFTLNFMSLVSGPIQRYDDYRSTAVERPLPLDAVALGGAIDRIVTGLFKIMVMTVALSSMRQALAPHAIDATSAAMRGFCAVTLAMLFPIYLYFNFSGYTDVVIGVARLFRIRLPENFDRPFTAASFIDYWNRWHMSLSNWLRTYVYNPLLTAAMRRLRHPALLPWVGAGALFVTFFLIGAWHGRTANFLFFGLLNGAGVAISQAYRIAMTRRLGRKPFAALAASPAYRFAGRGLTFTWVAFTLVWFWADWPEIGRVTHAVTVPVLAVWWVALVPAAAVVLGLLIAAENAIVGAGGGRGGAVLRSRYLRTALLTAMVAAIAAVQSVTQASAPDIVYKDF